MHADDAGYGRRQRAAKRSVAGGTRPPSGLSAIRLVVAPLRLGFWLRRFDDTAAARALARYAAAVAAGNLLWEILQLPLYTLWQTARASALAFAVLHCWVGDLLIAAMSLGLSIVVAGRSWPSRCYARVAVVALGLGIAYTVFGEWLNVTVRQNWNYAATMPRLPPLGTGLMPLLQWVLVPLVAFAWARPRYRRSESR